MSAVAGELAIAKMEDIFKDRLPRLLAGGETIMVTYSTFHNGAPHICERRIVMKDNGVAMDFNAQTLPKCMKIGFDRGGLHLRVALC